MLAGYKGLSRIYLAAGLTALAVVLRFFEIPYPPAPFLKYDLSGVPLGVMALVSLKLAYAALPVYYVISVAAMGSDPIGMAMKCLAEASTFTPLALAYTKLSARRLSRVGAGGVAVATSTATRVAVMSLMNYIVTPYWLIWAGWVRSWEDAVKAVLLYLPHVAAFNTSIALIVAPLTLVAYRVAFGKGTGK
ncbi:MAG: hypothetical protein ACP5KA_06360 [Desulfurococcaceae archaeon]